MTPDEIQSALGQFTGTTAHHRWSPFARNMVLTDGAKFVADECGAYWLMDAIASHQLDPKVRAEEFQVWTFKRGAPHTLTVTDGDSDKPIVCQQIDYSDFPLEKITLWVEGDHVQKVILLPSEH